MSEQEVTAQLSQVLPGFVDKLTPQGAFPRRTSLPESAAEFTRPFWGRWVHGQAFVRNM